MRKQIIIRSELHICPGTGGRNRYAGSDLHTGSNAHADSGNDPDAYPGSDPHACTHACSDPHTDACSYTDSETG